ncbi:hypothetical protein BH11GEM1_BH11GEM1_34670 [soil metagenome]
MRVTHWLTTFAFLALLLSGGEVLLSHPRFYWGEVGNVNTTPAFTIPVPSSRSTVPTRYSFRLSDQNGWSRYLHFQSAWLHQAYGRRLQIAIQHDQQVADRDLVLVSRRRRHEQLIVDELVTRPRPVLNRELADISSRPTAANRRHGHSLLGTGMNWQGRTPNIANLGQHHRPHDHANRIASTRRGPQPVRA